MVAEELLEGLEVLVLSQVVVNRLLWLLVHRLNLLVVVRLVRGLISPSGRLLVVLLLIATTSVLVIVWSLVVASLTFLLLLSWLVVLLIALRLVALLLWSLILVGFLSLLLSRILKVPIWSLTKVVAADTRGGASLFTVGLSLLISTSASLTLLSHTLVINCSIVEIP